MPIAYLLVTHGSRDVRPQLAIAQLAQMIQQKTHALIGTAALECAPQPLHEQILEFCDRAFAEGIHEIHIVPLFLLPGVHVMDDIPEEVKIAQERSRSKLILTSYLGTHRNLKAVLSRQFSDAAPAWILLSHGSRRSQGNQPVEALAKDLNVVPAYWSVEPKLEQRVEELHRSSVQKIGIVPYFLFSGGITDAIARSIEALSQRYPAIDLQLNMPFEVSDEFAELVIDLMMDCAAIA